MIKLNRIYTKTGDNGTTGLVRGPRRRKDDLRIEAYGTVDEANSCVGLARLSSASMPKIDNVLSRVQNDLFDVGSTSRRPARTRRANAFRCASRRRRPNGSKSRSTTTMRASPR